MEPESLSLCLCAAGWAGTKTCGVIFSSSHWTRDYSCPSAKQTTRTHMHGTPTPQVPGVALHMHMHGYVLMHTPCILHWIFLTLTTARGCMTLTAANAATAVLTADKWPRTVYITLDLQSRGNGGCHGNHIQPERGGWEEGQGWTIKEFTIASANAPWAAFSSEPCNLTVASLSEIVDEKNCL